MPAGDALLGTSVIDNLRRLRIETAAPENEIAAIANSRLSVILHHAVDKVPFYRALAPPFHADPYKWLLRFPVVGKSEINNQQKRLLADGGGPLVACPSSGSSGIQSTVYVDHGDRARSRAIQLLWWEWAGYRMGKPLLQTGITPNRGFQKGLKDRVLRTDYRPAFNLSESHALDILSEWSRPIPAVNS